MSNAVTISDRLSGANPKIIVATIGLQCSWELSAIGVLTCGIKLDELLAAGLRPRQLLGKWIKYSHPRAGTWGGQITSTIAQDGVVAISAESWASGLRGVITDGLNESGAAAVGTDGTPIGDLVKSLKRLIDTNTNISGVKTGSPFAATAGIPSFGGELDKGQDIFDSLLPTVLDRILQQSPNTGLRAAGYTIDPATRVMTLSHQMGRDLTAGSNPVRLDDGTHNASSSWGDDLTDVINRVTIDGTSSVSTTTGGDCLKWKTKKDKKGKKKRVCIKKSPIETTTTNDEFTVVRLNQASIDQYGIRNLSESTSQNWASEAALEAYATARVAALSRNEQTVTISVPTEYDAGAVVANIREGDMFLCGLANSGATGKAIARVRALDAEQGLMVYAGEAELT